MADVKSTFFELQELFSLCPEAEQLAEIALTKFVLKESNVKTFRRRLLDLTSILVEHFSTRIASAEESVGRYRNAWFDIARYQTDPLDAALTWSVDPDILQIMLDHRPVPTETAARHNLSVPPAVRKLRENSDGYMNMKSFVQPQMKSKVDSNATPIVSVIISSEDRKQIPWS